MNKMIKGELVRGTSGIKMQEMSKCDFCKQGKLPQKSHPAMGVHGKGMDIPDVVVVDLAGPNKSQTLGGKSYDIVVVDTNTQRSFVTLLAKKSAATKQLMRWIPQVELQTRKNCRGFVLSTMESCSCGIFPSSWYFVASCSRALGATRRKATTSG